MTWLVVVTADVIDNDWGNNVPGPLDFVWKQAVARCVVSRWTVRELSVGASARYAVEILDALTERMPSGVRAPHCIPVARSQTTAGRALRPAHTKDCQEITDAEATLAGLRRAAPMECRHHRPSIGYLTTAEYLASLGIDV